MDELETDGTVSSDTDDSYKFKAIKLINILQRELARAEGIEITDITALTDTLKISNDSAERILPYGLAAKFALADQSDMFQVYQAEYKSLMRTIPAIEENFTDSMNIMSGF